MLLAFEKDDKSIADYSNRIMLYDDFVDYLIYTYSVFKYFIIFNIDMYPIYLYVMNCDTYQSRCEFC